jgi:hypothetical protein
MTSKQREIDAFEKLSPLQQRQALHRWSVVNLWIAARQLGSGIELDEPSAAARAMEMLAMVGVSVCSGTVRNWERAYRKGGVEGLADQRKLPRGRLRQYGQFFCHLEKLYTRPGLHSMEVCHELTTWQAEYDGWPVPQLRDSQRYLKKYILPGLTAERGGEFEGGSNRASNDI